MAVTHGFERARRLNDTFAETVVVFGVGPLGMCHLIKARLMGAGQLIAIDRFPSRLQRAGAFGAGMVLDAGQLEGDELIARVREATQGRGADMILDCSGVPETFVTSLRMVRVGGTVVEAGAFVDMGPVQINPNADICTKNVNVIGVGGETAESYKPAMDLLVRHLTTLPLETFVSHRLPLERAQEGLELSPTAVTP
jgi:L-iditol 2-dehydrogenase